MVQNTHDVRDRNPHSPEPIAKDLSTDIITVPDVELGSARSPPPPLHWQSGPRDRNADPPGGRCLPDHAEYRDGRNTGIHALRHRI